MFLNCRAENWTWWFDQSLLDRGQGYQTRRSRLSIGSRNSILEGSTRQVFVPHRWEQRATGTIAYNGWFNWIKWINFDWPTDFQARIAADLIELRNKSVFFFIMFNALFILIVFLLQLNKDALNVEWPLGIKTNITYIEETSEVLITNEPLRLEPIGLVFVFFFGLILIIQFVAMLFHRFGTLSHILASTELTCCSPKDVNTWKLLLIIS